MIVFANWKELKDISEIHRRQKENHRQKKKKKIRKNLWKIYSSDSVTLTSRSLSEIAESQIEEDSQNFEFDSKEQFKRNNTSCLKTSRTKRTCSRNNFFQKHLKQILMTWRVLFIVTSSWKRRLWFQKTKYVRLSTNANSTASRIRTKYRIVYWKFW
jgi:hypothetical protein